MSDSPNLALVRRLYDSGMAPAVATEVIEPWGGGKPAEI